MTTDNQSTNSLTPIEDAPNFSKAATLGRNNVSRNDKTSTALKTLSLRPTKSVKKNSSFKPTKKLK